MLDQMTAKTAPWVVLANLTQRKDQEWMAHLKGTSTAWFGQTLSRLADIQVALEEDQNRHAMILYNPPFRDIQWSLEQGEAPAEALVAWQEFAESLVIISESFPDRTVLAIVPESSEELLSLVRYSQKALHIKVENSANTLHIPHIHKTVNEQIDFTLAASLLLTLRQPIELIRQLEELSVPIRSKPYLPELIETFLESRGELSKIKAQVEKHKIEKREQKSRIESVSEENSRVIDQLHKTQEELERHIISQRELNQKISKMRRGRDYRKDKIAQLSKTIQDRDAKITALQRGREYRISKISSLETAVREREVKIDWLRRVRNEHRRAARELRAQVRTNEVSISDLRNEYLKTRRDLEKIKKSKSWKYTKLLRKISK